MTLIYLNNIQICDVFRSFCRSNYSIIMASFHQRSFGRGIRRMRSMSPNEEEPESYRFQFNINEANELDSQAPTDAGLIPPNDDFQQQNLTAGELQQLFSRASCDLVPESTDEQEFFKRETTIKAPKTGQVIQTPFPPPELDRPEDLEIDIEKLNQLAKQEAGALIIERYSPNKSKIDYVLSAVTLTFNQPMIAVSSLNEQTNVEQLGISLEPNTEGFWRWKGTTTVQFETKHHLPYSTHYKLKVHKERCVSAIGGKYIFNY